MDPKKLAAVEDTGDRDRLTVLLAAAGAFASALGIRAAELDPRRELAVKLPSVSWVVVVEATGSSWNRCGGAAQRDIILGWSAAVPPGGWAGL
jgi:hypothetical protein